MIITGRRQECVLALPVMALDSPIKANRHSERVCEALRVPIAKKDV